MKKMKKMKKNDHIMDTHASTCVLHSAPLCPRLDQGAQKVLLGHV